MNRRKFFAVMAGISAAAVSFGLGRRGGVESCAATEDIGLRYVPETPYEVSPAPARIISMEVWGVTAQPGDIASVHGGEPSMWVCVTGGCPGTWKPLSPAEAQSPYDV